MGASSADKLNFDFSVPLQAVPLITGLEGSDPWIQQPNDALVALMRASEARQRGESWRDYPVGAAAITLFDNHYERMIYHGANFKPRKTSGINTHAEEEILTGSKGTVSVLAVVAETDYGDPDRLQTPTTVPCDYRCTPLLDKSERIEPRTLILSATPDFTVVQYYDIRSLVDAQNCKYPELLTTVRFETPNMQDDQEWLEKFSIPLINYRQSFASKNPPR